MATANVNDDGRLVAWSVNDLFEYPLDNPEEIDANYCGQMEDFVYEDGIATFAPTAATATERRVAELKQALSDTDYYAAKSIEGLVECTSAEEIVAWAAGVTEQYGNMIAQRKEWREELSSLGE